MAPGLRRGDRCKREKMALRFGFLFIFLCLPFLSALAADGKTAAGVDEKTALILQLYEVNPPADLINASIESIARQRYPEGADRQVFMDRMKLAVDYDRMESFSTNLMREMFTLEELKAMVAYYTSPVGISAQEKIGGYRQKMAPELRKMLDKALLDGVTGSPSE